MSAAEYLATVEARINAAAAAPWRVERHDRTLWVHSADEGLEANLGYIGNRPEGDADLIANAPTDLTKLVAAIEAVTALAEKLESMASESSYIGSEDRTEALLEAAILVRAAITEALGATE